MGIYGKVLPKSANGSDVDYGTENSAVSTPLPFLLPGQDKKILGSLKGRSQEKPKGPKDNVHLKTPSPEIKVKGHRSKEVVEPGASEDSSRDYASEPN